MGNNIPAIMEQYAKDERSAWHRASRLIHQQGLDSKSIDGYDLQDLRAALDRIDLLIDSSELDFPRVKTRLLDRKTAILVRIQLLSSQEGIRGLQDLVNAIEDTEDRRRLTDELRSLQTTASSLAKQSQATEKERQAAQRDESLLQQELMERRWAIWSKLMARESVATLAGSLLLVALAATLITAMFLGVEASAIISNSFLIILGYFFGQNAERRSGRD